MTCISGKADLRKRLNLAELSIALHMRSQTHRSRSPIWASVQKNWDSPVDIDSIRGVSSTSYDKLVSFQRSKATFIADRKMHGHADICKVFVESQDVRCLHWVLHHRSDLAANGLTAKGHARACHLAESKVFVHRRTWPYTLSPTTALWLVQD